MDSRLYQASLRGDVDTLNILIPENPLILEEARVERLNQTPLHIAASLGHLKFTSALLNLDSNLASKHDSCNRFPLHLASENGHVEIVRELLLADMGLDNSVCKRKDTKGRIPLHLAVMQGHVKVILELIAAQPESTMVTMDKTGESVLHLCVKYNRLEALKLLLDLAPDRLVKLTLDKTGESVLHLCVKYNRLEALKLLLDLTPDGLDLVKYKDTEGNTVLHVGAALNQTEIVKYLLSIPEVIEIANDRNKKGFTALMESEEYSAIKHSSTRMIIQDSLDKARISGLLKDHINIPSRVLLFMKKNLCATDDEWMKEYRGHLLTAGALIAAVTYQTGLAPPGGVWQDGNKKGSPNSHEAAPAPSPGDVNHEPGTSIIASEKWDMHNRFVVSNTFSFTASLLVILLLLSGISSQKKIPKAILHIFVLASILSMAFTYSISIDMMTPWTEHRQSILNIGFIEIMILYVLSSFCFMRNYMYGVLYFMYGVLYSMYGVLYFMYGVLKRYVKTEKASTANHPEPGQV